MAIYPSIKSKGIDRLRVQRKASRELERPQPVLNSLDHLAEIATDKDAGIPAASGSEARGPQHGARRGTAEIRHRLAEQVGARGDLDGAGRRVQWRGSGEGEQTRGVGAGGDDDGVEIRRVGRGIGLVDAGRETLGHDGHDEAVGGETRLELLRLVHRARGRGPLDGERRGQHADLERRDGGQRAVGDGDAARRVGVVVRGVGRGRAEAERRRDAGRDVVADLVQLRQHVGFHGRGPQVARLEADRVDEELLLHGLERVVEEARLRPVVREGRGQAPRETPARAARGRGEEAAAGGLVGLLREAAV